MADTLGQGSVGAALNRVGRLIAFEGPNEVGKTTLSRALMERLRRHAIPCETQAFPGRSPGSLGNHIYQLHHDPGKFGIEAIAPAALQALHIAAHLDAIERTILPKLAAGIDVILDRFWWSAVAYGIANGVSERLLDSLVRSELIAWGDRTPALVIVLERRAVSGAGTIFVDTLREQYSKLVHEAHGRHPACILENNGTVEQAAAQVATLLERADAWLGNIN